MANSEETLCFICEESLIDGKTILVKQKGLNTFRECSRKRNDGKSDKYLINRLSVTVHDACRKQYTNKKLIAVANRRGFDTVLQDAPSSSRRSDVPEFDFKKCCFLCSAEITEEYLRHLKKSRLSSRDTIYDVRTLKMIENVLTRAQNRHDDWGRAICERIGNIHDLVAVEARYHNNCLKKLFGPLPAEKKRGYQRR